MVHFSLDSDKQDYLGVLLATNAALQSDAENDACLRQVNFMTYELNSLYADCPEHEKLQALNKFLFINKNFKPAARPISLEDILDARSGSITALAFLYLHLAKSLGLTLQLVHWPLHAILKWVNENGKTAFIDLEQKGKILCEEEVLVMINKHSVQVQTLPYRDSVLQYLAGVANSLRQNEEFENLHKLLNFILHCEPENTRVLSERALLRKQLGLYKESLSDFKRFFAFNDRHTASQELNDAFEFVRSFCMANLNNDAHTI